MKIEIRIPWDIVSRNSSKLSITSKNMGIFASGASGDYTILEIVQVETFKKLLR